jgi:hypothetical protein
VTRFLGINFIHTEKSRDANRHGRCGTARRSSPIWTKAGMHLGMWNDIRRSISVRSDLRGEPFQAYNYMTIGATRIEERSHQGVVPLIVR